MLRKAGHERHPHADRDRGSAAARSRGSTKAPAFDLSQRHKIVKTNNDGAASMDDIGADELERIAVQAKGDSDLMLRMLLAAAAVGPNGSASRQ